MKPIKEVAPIIVSVCAVLLYGGSLPTYGALVKWTLNDVTLQGVHVAPASGDWSGTASGSFLYDAQSQTVEDWDIVIAEESSSTTEIFTPALLDASASRTAGPPDVFMFNNASGFFRLVTPALTDAGGVKLLVGGHLFAAIYFGDADVTGGSLTGIVVPEPTSTAYIVLGLAVVLGSSLVRSYGVRT